jgi:hypothetical protein
MIPPPQSLLPARLYAPAIVGDWTHMDRRGSLFGQPGEGREAPAEAGQRLRARLALPARGGGGGGVAVRGGEGGGGGGAGAGQVAAVVGTVEAVEGLRVGFLSGEPEVTDVCQWSNHGRPIS